MMDALVKEVFVPVSPDVAFRRFTEEMATWWPIETHTVHAGEPSRVEFEGRVGGRLYEHTPEGRAAEWGIVTSWAPPDRVAFTWYPGRTAETAQPVEVTFTAEPGGTRLRLVHGGWEILGDDAREAHAGYDAGWTSVLERYADSLQVGV